MYLHGSHNKNYVHVALASHIPSSSLAFLRSVLCVILLISYHSFRIHNGNCLHFSHSTRLGIYFSLQAAFMSSHAQRDISWDTERKWWENGLRELCFSSSAKARCESSTKQQRKPETWWWLGLMIWDGVGILSSTWGGKFFRWKFLLFTAKHLNVEGVRREKIMYLFLLPRREERIFFFISQHTWFADSPRFLFLSEPRRREKRLVNEPSASGDGILLLFLYGTHMMGVCRVCLWIICVFMLAKGKGEWGAAGEAGNFSFAT